MYGLGFALVAMLAALVTLPTAVSDTHAQTSVPETPTGLTAPSVSHNSATLNWNDPGDSSITGYLVLRRSREGDTYGDGRGAAAFVPVDYDTGSSVTTYTDTSVTPRTRYVYRVKAINPAGMSARSTYLNVETSDTPASSLEQVLPKPVAGAVWSAEMRVADVGSRKGHPYLGYSTIKESGELSSTRFKYKDRDYEIYALGFSDAAQTLGLSINLPLGTTFTLHIGEDEFSIADATTSQSQSIRLYEWEAMGLNWAMGDMVEVYLIPANTSRPNVVIIVADDLGWGDLRTNNPQSSMTTPRMDGLAVSGVNFTDAHSPSSACTGTRYGLLTGRYAWRSWMSTGVLNARDRPLIGPDRPTLGTLLQGHGYRTAAIGKWHLGMDFGRLTNIDDVNSLNRGIDFDAEILDSPIDHGFHEFFGSSGNLAYSFPLVYIRDQRFAANPALERKPHSGRIVFNEVLGRLTEEAVSFIERSAQTDDPFFLYFPLNAPHDPLAPREDFRGTTELGAYGDFVAQVDWTVGQVLETLERTGELNNTVVILTSDNGSGMHRLPNHVSDQTVNTDIWGYNVGRHQSNAEWRQGKGSVYEGGHRIPLMMQWPAVIEAGSTIAATVSLTDLYGTLAGVVGDEPEQGVAIDSVSLLPLLLGEAVTREESVVHHSNRGLFAVRDGWWKLVFNDPRELYDLERDSRESRNRAGDHPQVVEQLEATLDRIRAAEDGTLPGDSTLRSLHIAGLDIETFDPGVLTYTAFVSREVESVEVVAVPNATDSRVTISTPNGQLRFGKPLRGRVEVGLATPATIITVRVIAPDKSANTHYTVTLRQQLLAIMGRAQVGETLTADTSAITGPGGLANAVFTFQWVRKDGSAESDIAGAQGSTYILVPADEGKTIRVRVSFTDDASNDEILTSAATIRVAPPNTPAAGNPTITGIARVTETLTADNSAVSDADGLANAIFSYQWLADGTDIPGATDSTHSLGPTDEGKAFTVRVSFTDDAVNTETLTSAATTPVAPRPGNSPATGLPAITGTAQVAEKLRAVTAGIIDADGLTNAVFSYQWLADGTDIPGATGSTLRLGTDDEEKAVRVRVSFTDDSDNTEMLTSPPTPPVEPLDQQPPGPPEQLRAAVSDGAVTLSWHAPADAHKVAGYRVLRHRPEEGEPEPLVYVEFSRSTATAYTDTGVQPGVLYVYRVQGVDYFGHAGEPSAPAAVLVPGPNGPGEVGPIITGNAQVGETLTAYTLTITDAEGLTNAAFTYQWLRNDGNADSEIAGATDSAYTLVPADEGKTVAVRVSFTDDADNTETRTSSATAPVEQAPTPLTARFMDVPVSHDGQTSLTFELRFSEEVELGYSALQDHAFTIAGGEVTGVRRLQRPNNIRWEITVSPSGGQDVTVILPVTGDCNDQGAICTDDDRMLSNRTELTVPGPGG